MKIFPKFKNAFTIQIRQSYNYGGKKLAKIPNLSMTVYDTSLAELKAVMEKAIKSKCK